MSKIEAPKVGKSSKNDGGLFKITLFAYPQQGPKNHPSGPHFGEVFGAKIEPRWTKSRLENKTKIKMIFHQIFLRFGLHFGPSRRP